MRITKNRGAKGYIRSLVNAHLLPSPFTPENVAPLVRDQFPDMIGTGGQRCTRIGAMLRELVKDGVIKGYGFRAGVYDYVNGKPEAKKPEPQMALPLPEVVKAPPMDTPEDETKALNEALKALVTIEAVLRRHIERRRSLDALVDALKGL